ncbi:hypothetical protein BCIN_12g05440 [Botrytis cinerea B05.10]|uniref:Uncharacterized protein n=2 Tax=Botryotinia fuckeliana TaxID=40559 RepID=A0A384K044_BOTFB|nr:hypothetical protein BCIN_12g05440 [Botrytis cinerea B05.10]ATZ56004.1 hypothetical protein BCIN_12g05440 [Botrytis cinerea B05.10]
MKFKLTFPLPNKVVANLTEPEPLFEVHALTISNSPYLMCEPIYLGEERFQRWPSPGNLAEPHQLEFSLAIVRNRMNQFPFTITFPSDLYRDIKKSQRMRDKMPDVNLADMSGDNSIDGIPWPDFHDIENPPISEDQMESIGYHIDLMESELLGPIKGPTIIDEDFIVQKLGLNQKRTKEEPFEDIPFNLFELKFFEARVQSFDSAMRAGEGPQLPEWTHQGFDINEEEDMALLDREEIKKGLRNYDASYRANYFNPDFAPEKRLGSSKKPGAMTNWYRKGPVGRGRNPPPKPRQDAAERMSQDHIWLLQEDNLASAKDKEDTEMSGMNMSGKGNVVSVGAIGMNATIDVSGPSGFNSSFSQTNTLTGTSGPSGFNSGLGQINTMNNTPGPSGYKSSFVGANTANNSAGPSGYNSGAASRVIPANTSVTATNNTLGSSTYNPRTFSSAASINVPMASIISAPGPPAHNSGSIAKNIANATPGSSGDNSETIRANSLSSTAVPSGYTSRPDGNNSMNAAANPSRHNTLSTPTPRETVSTRGIDGTNAMSESSNSFPGYNQGYTKSSAEPVRHNYVKSFPTHDASIPPNINPHTISEVQSREITHEPNISTIAVVTPVHVPAPAPAPTSGEIFQTTSTTQNLGMENLVPVNKKMAARDEKDKDWQPGQKPKTKATRKTTVPEAATDNPTPSKTINREIATPRTRKPKTINPIVASSIVTSHTAISPTVATPNLIKSAAVPKTRNSRAATPKTAGPKSAVSKATTPMITTPMTATPRTTTPRTITTRANTPKTSTTKSATPKTSATRAKASKSSTPKSSSFTSTPTLKPPITRNSSLKKSISEESADGTWEPDEDY